MLAVAAMVLVVGAVLAAFAGGADRSGPFAVTRWVSDSAEVLEMGETQARVITTDGCVVVRLDRLREEEYVVLGTSEPTPRPPELTEGDLVGMSGFAVRPEDHRVRVSYVPDRCPADLRVWRIGAIRVIGHPPFS